MSNTAKPETKKAPAKKMGRPLGSKNKPKEPARYQLTQTQLMLAKKLGVSPEDFTRELIKQKMIKPVKVNWQELAKRLQEALESQIKENKCLIEKLDIIEKESDEIAAHHRNLLNIIHYLEQKLGIHSV